MNDVVEDIDSWSDDETRTEFLHRAVRTHMSPDDREDVFSHTFDFGIRYQASDRFEWLGE